MNYFNQETQRLILRKVNLDDVTSWTEFFENNDRLHFLGLDMTKSFPELSQGWIEIQMQRYEQEGLGMLGAIEKSTNELVGLCGIVPREIDGNKYHEIAYSFKPKVWGKGYATEASNQFREFGLRHEIDSQFISIIDLENYASQAVARKNQMEVLFDTLYYDSKVHIFGTIKTNK
jgi:ribosomal-protein-alanine N-acetyltransferase